MADLEKLLLEAAGRTTASGRNRHSSPPSRRRRKGSYSDDGSDSKNDDSDGDHPYPNRKLPGSQVPLKKRLDPTDRDDDHSSQEGERYDRDHDSDNDSVGSDLYKNEDDREKLSKLTELEREMILEARATKRSDRDLTEKLKKRKGQHGKGSPPKAHTRSMRPKAERARAGALDELLKRRRDAKAGSGSRYSPVKRRSFTAVTLSSPSRSDSGSHSDEGDSTGDGGMADSDDDKAASDSKSVTFEDIKEITIRKSKLIKWFMEPWFDESIVGCFVRLNIGNSRSGPIYRLCVVRNVDASDSAKQYKIDNKTTCKYLNLVWGSESSACRWKIIKASDSPPLKKEYEQWLKEMEQNNAHLPTKQEVLEKREAIQKISTSYVYTPAAVKKILQEKKSATWKPLNVAAEKDRLRSSLEVAKEMDDEAEVERIKARLQELEAARQVQVKDSKAIKLAEMNKRNRAENFKNASELKPVNTGLKAGEAGYDPFSRRWTRSRNYYVGNPSAEESATAAAAAAAAAVPISSGGVIPSAESGMAATTAALEAAADAGKLIDTSAPVDQGTESNLLHNFELPISLAMLQKFGGPQGVQAGFLARKQRIEATIGCKVPDNDGRRHALTLTVSDYKRRRGLL